MRALSKDHVIAGHTLTHTAIENDAPGALMAREICESKRVLKKQLGRETKSFAWLRGGKVGLNPRADAYLRRAGYSYLFSIKVQTLTAEAA